MKKYILMALMFLMLGVGQSMAGDTYAHSDAVLPAAAKSVLAKNFKAKVSLVKVDKTLGMIDEYEVIMNDGSEISFDKNGNWKEVEVSESSSVPSGFVPTAISNFVKKNHKGLRVVGIKKDRSGYEVELSNGIDIDFDSNGAFKRYDD